MWPKFRILASWVSVEILLFSEKKGGGGGEGGKASNKQYREYVFQIWLHLTIKAAWNIRLKSFKNNLP